jgi:3-oxoacyl-[acyl-carrier protein] reductase
MEGLEGKTALVTGGAGGIGSSIGEALLESGGRVFLHDLPTSDGEAKARSLCQKFGDGRAIFVAGDLNDLAALNRESATRAAEVDGFDFLVNNAAIDPVGPIEAYSIEHFLAVQTINAHAAFVLCQTLAPYMKRKGGGAIVSVMSVVLSGGWAEKVPYAMSKGALLGLTRSLARELGPHHIQVNAVSPERFQSQWSTSTTPPPAERPTTNGPSASNPCRSARTSAMSPIRCSICFRRSAGSSPGRSCM